MGHSFNSGAPLSYLTAVAEYKISILLQFDNNDGSFIHKHAFAMFVCEQISLVVYYTFDSNVGPFPVWKVENSNVWRPSEELVDGESTFVCDSFLHLLLGTRC